MEIVNLPEFVKTLVFASIGIIILFIVLHFVVSLVSLWLSSKIVKSINDEFTSALKVVGLWILFSVASSAFGFLLNFLPESLSLVVNILSVLSLFVFVGASLWVVKKIYDLTPWETVKMLVIAWLMQFAFFSVVVIVFGGMIVGLVTHKMQSLDFEQASVSIIEEKGNVVDQPQEKEELKTDEDLLLIASITPENVALELCNSILPQNKTFLFQKDESLLSEDEIKIKKEVQPLVYKRSYCFDMLAYAEKNPKYCEDSLLYTNPTNNSNNNNDPSCHARVAVAKNDISLCENMPQNNLSAALFQGRKSNCRNLYAYYLNDLSVCNDEEDDFKKGSCFLILAKNPDNKDYCKLIDSNNPYYDHCTPYDTSNLDILDCELEGFNTDH